MRIITPEIVKKWPRLGNRNNPRPFPGMYPTRWLIEGGYYAPRPHANAPRVFHRRLFYFGKPSRMVARQVQQIARRKSGGISFWEFDRGGLIKWGQRAIPRTDLTIDGYELLLCGLYYFRDGVFSDMFAQRGRARLWDERKILKFDGHKVLVYDDSTLGPWDPMMEASARQWLQNTKFEWK